MNSINWNRWAKILTSISFLLICFSLFEIARNPATGYEISIYSATPIIFWIAISINYLNGIATTVLNVLNKIEKMGIIGIFQILYCNVLLLILYWIRGYVYIERSDTLSYIGMAKDISNIGFISSNNFYPLIGILSSQLSQITNQSIDLISCYLPALFFIFYIISIYCLAKTLCMDEKYIYCVLLAASPIFFAWFSQTIMYMSLSVYTIPFFIYILEKNKSVSYRILCVIWCYIYPLFHPITSIFILIYIFIYFLTYYIPMKYNSNLQKRVTPSFFLLTFVSICTWFLSQYLITKSIHMLLIKITSSSQTSMTESMGFVSKLGFISSIKSFLLIANDEMMYYMISAIAIIYIYHSMNRTSFKRKYIGITSCFIGGSLFFILIFMLTSVHTPYRLINLCPNMTFTPLLVGYILYDITRYNKKVKAFLIISLIIISSFTSIISLYPSPSTSLPNTQVTTSEIIGMNWLISSKNINIRTADEKMAVFRYADYIYGSNLRLQRSDFERDFIIPNHFGFLEKNIIPTDKSRYLVISDYVIQAHTIVWKDLNMFNNDDFFKVNRCINTDKIYENGEFRTYFITSR